MKQLLTRFLIYAAIISLTYWVYLTFMSHVLNEDRLYKLDPKKTVLVIGDSHTAFGIIDSNMTHVANLSQSADVYLYNYRKMQKLLPLNPQIHTVMIGFGGHDVQQFMAKVFLKRHEFTKAKVQNYYHLLSAADMSYLLFQSPTQVIKGVVGLPKLKTPYLLKIMRGRRMNLEDDIKFGGFSFRDDTLDLKKNFADVAKLEKDKEDLLSMWPWQIDYLHKLVDLCKAHHVKVIFIRMPEHKLFPRSIEPDFQAFRKKEFGEIPFVDFIKMDFPDSCFADLDHLNYYGARIFTDSFAHYAATIE
jgi:hypothetical protein